MKVVPRGGHNHQCPGASAVDVGGLDEVTEDRLVDIYTTSNLIRAGVETLDGTPGNCGQNDDLNYGTNTANNANADLFLPIHFNKAYDNLYKGAIGSELWINPKNPQAVAIGTRILNNLAALGFKNRGLKDGMNVEHLHDIRASKGTAVLVEVCFCEASEDIRIYKKVGPAAVGKAISDGVVGVTSSKTQIPVVANPNAPVVIPATRVNNSVAQLQAELNKQGFGHLVVDGFDGPLTRKACPVIRQGAEGELTRWIQKRLGLKLQDGIFGTGTTTAVIMYQRAVGLEADGIVGKNTWTAMLR